MYTSDIFVSDIVFFSAFHFEYIMVYFIILVIMAEGVVEAE